MPKGGAGSGRAGGAGAGGSGRSRRPGGGSGRAARPGAGSQRRRSAASELLSARLRKGIDRALHPYVDEAEALSRRFIDDAHARFGAELAFDLDHVRRLDNVIRNGREAFDDEMVLGAGFWLGETLRKVYGGRYQWHPGKDALSLEIEGLVTFPIEKVRTVVSEGARAADRSDGLEAYLMVLAKRIASKRAERRAADAGGAGG